MKSFSLTGVTTALIFIASTAHAQDPDTSCQRQDDADSCSVFYYCQGSRPINDASVYYCSVSIFNHTCAYLAKSTNAQPGDTLSFGSKSVFLNEVDPPSENGPISVAFSFDDLEYYLETVENCADETATLDCVFVTGAFPCGLS